jgi:hypothetical protein
MTTKVTIIAKEEDDGTIKGFTCLGNEPINTRGLVLCDYYSDENKLNDLIKLGTSQHLKEERKNCNLTKSSQGIAYYWNNKLELLSEARESFIFDYVYLYDSRKRWLVYNKKRKKLLSLNRVLNFIYPKRVMFKQLKASIESRR